MTIPSIKFPSNPKPAPVLSFGSGTRLYNKPSAALVEEALKIGFRSIDAAEVYANSASNGEGITKSGIPKEEIFVLSKVNGAIKDGRDAIIAAGRKERTDLQVEALDALILHHPPRGKDGEPSNLEAWKALEALRDEGVTKTIGVSNWLAPDLKEVIEAQPKHPIEINEIEFHPLLWGDQKTRDLLAYAKEKGVTIAVYASLTPLTNATVKPDSPIRKAVAEIAKAKPGRSEGGVLHLWARQKTDGIIVTTSTQPSLRLPEYLKLFESDDQLTDAEIKAIDDAGVATGVLKGYMKPYW